MKKKSLVPILFWCTVVICAVSLVSHNYNDLIITTRHGINFWDILLDGKFLSFYELNRCVSGNVVYDHFQGCAYNILVYTAFAIWNLPLYLLERFAGVDVMNSVPCLVYAKLLIAAGMVATVVLFKKILKELEIPEEKHNLMVYLYASSTLLTTVVFITGQYDIFSLVFQLLGVLAFIKGKDRAFVWWFGLAVCFKYFALVIFLPLMLLKQKKVLSWIKSLVILIVPLLITKLPFILHGMLSQSATGSGVRGDMMGVGLMASMLGSSNANININFFVIAYASILVWCYLQKDDPETNAYNGIWASLLAYAAFFGLMKAYPYWPVIMAPFVTLVIVMAPHQLYLNLILETIGVAAFVFANMVRYPWVYFGETLKPMIWPYLLKGSGFNADYTGSLISGLVSWLKSETYYGTEAFPAIANSAFVAAVIIMTMLAYPGNKGNRLQKWPDEKEYWDVLLARFAVNAVVCLLPILAIFV